MTVIRHYTGLNRTPALPLALRGWMALVESGHCGNTILIHAEQDAVVAFVHDVPVGVITYRPCRTNKELLIGIGYIEPDHRGNGLYDLLWEELVRRSRALDITHIISATYASNTGMRKAASRQGRIETNVTLEYAIPSNK